MISDPNLVLYACISKGTTIIAELNSDDSKLETLASQCLEKTPPFHSIFSHTIRKRTYTFLIDGPDPPFVYFAIFDEDLDRSQGLWFLNRMKGSLNEIIKKKSMNLSENLIFKSLQKEFNPIFRELLTPQVGLFEPVNSVQNSTLRDSRNGSMDSSRGKKMVSAPLLGKPGKGLKKKKRSGGDGDGNSKDITMENKVDVSDDTSGNLNREFSLALHKNNGLYVGGDTGGRQKVKQIWRRHVWAVLLIDLFVCLILFGVWLWVCKGFKCIEG